MNYEMFVRATGGGLIQRAVLGSALLLLMVLSASGPLAAQEVGQIAVQVTGGDGEPVLAARIQMQEGGVEGLTAADGRLVIRSIPPGSHPVTIVAFGYRAITEQVSVPPGGIATLNRSVWRPGR